MTKIETKFLNAIRTTEGGTFPKRIAVGLLGAGYIEPASWATFDEGSQFRNAGSYVLTEKGMAACHIASVERV